MGILVSISDSKAGSSLVRCLVLFFLIGLFTPLFSYAIILLGGTSLSREHPSFRYVMDVTVPVTSPGFLIYIYGFQPGKSSPDFFLFVSIAANGFFYCMAGVIVWLGIHRNRMLLFLPPIIIVLLAMYGIYYLRF